MSRNGQSSTISDVERWPRGESWSTASATGFPRHRCTNAGEGGCMCEVHDCGAHDPHTGDMYDPVIAA